MVSNKRYCAPGFSLKLQCFKCWPDRFQSQGFKIAFQHIGSLSVNRRKGFSLLFPVSQHQRRCGTNNCFLSLSCCPALTELAPPAVELSQVVWVRTLLATFLYSKIFLLNFTPFQRSFYMCLINISNCKITLFCVSIHELDMNWRKVWHARTQFAILKETETS